MEFGTFRKKKIKRETKRLKYAERNQKETVNIYKLKDQGYVNYVFVLL